MPEFPLAALERILKNQGASRVSRKACEEFSIILEEIAVHLAKEADTLAQHAGRRTIIAEDVRLAKKRGPGI